MKQLYRMPFERNSVRVKDLRHDYVQVCVTLHTIYCNVGMRVYAATCPVACNFYGPNPPPIENIDIVVTVCVFSNTFQNFLYRVLDFDAVELPRVHLHG